MSGYKEVDFKLAKNEDELPAPAASSAKFHQITASRSLTGGNFYNGRISFPFEFGSHQYIDFKKSFLRIRLEVKQSVVADAALIQPQVGTTDVVALAMNVCSTLFQSCEIRIGGRVVSKCGDNIAQCSTMKERIMNTKNWLDTVGISARLMEPKWSDRNKRVASDSSEIMSGMTGFTNLELTWRCPLGIWSQSDLIPCGSRMELSLVPYTLGVVAKRSVETRTDAKAAVVYSPTGALRYNYNFEVDEMYLYLYVIDKTHIEDGEVWLDLNEIRMQSEDQTSAGFTQHTFNVSPSTKRLQVAFQDNKAGTETAYSPTSFSIGGSADLYVLATDKLETTCNRLSIQYAGQTLTPLDLDTDFDVATVIDRKQYLTYAYQSLMSEMDEPNETLSDYINRGLYFNFEVAKDSKIRSTIAKVGVGFSQTPTRGRVLLFDWSMNKLKLVYKSGRLVDTELIEG